MIVRRGPKYSIKKVGSIKLSSVKISLSKKVKDIAAIYPLLKLHKFSRSSLRRKS